MIETLLERAWMWIHATFPERQIYIRSDGRVQFFTFSPILQASMAGLTLLILGWVAFASVNVIFKSHIIAAKNHRFQAMQANYESRIADLQMSYDELNGALVSAQDRFKTTADQLERKQQAVAQLLGRRDLIGPSSGVAAEIPRAATAATASDSVGAAIPSMGAFGTSDGSSELTILPQPVAPQPRTAHPTRASFLDGTIETLAGAATALFHHQAKSQGFSTAALRHPALRGLAEQTTRLERLNGTETAMLKSADAQVSSRIANVEGVMRRVGLNPNTMEGMGGPLLPAADVRIAGIDDPGFAAAYVDASAHGKFLNELYAALKHVPLTTPVHGSGFELTSDFGPRVDPFTHRVAFHPGLDFGGPWGSPVDATAPGKVIYAGPRGGYGNMVEIDHGYGIHTRYGHLSSILVHVGATVQKGAPVGRLGSTGRSTGPHVHYEVWLASALRDPSRFIEAGRHVQ
ncbi:MAG TPA: peptidoglycan DD-metalloendopeptidase family protein [Rhizomicrobium sp.]